MNEAVTSLMGPSQRYRMTRFLVFLSLALVLAFGSLMWSGNMLLPWHWRLLAASVVGIVLGTLGLAAAGFWILPWYGWLRSRPGKGRVSMAWLWMGMPCWFMIGQCLWLISMYTVPALQPTFFEKSTGRKWPANVRLLASGHSFLLADSKRFWFFESEPSAFDAFLQRGDWPNIHEEDLQWDLVSRGFPWRLVHVDDFPEWVPAEFWRWDSAKEATQGPFGPLYLITDQQRRRWCVWYDGF